MTLKCGVISSCGLMPRSTTWERDFPPTVSPQTLSLGKTPFDQQHGSPHESEGATAAPPKTASHDDGIESSILLWNGS